MTDLLTNTMGTVLGVALFRLACVKSFIVRTLEPRAGMAGKNVGSMTIDIGEPHESVPHSA